MNIRVKKNSRIQQAPMGPSRRVPASVQFIKGRHQESLSRELQVQLQPRSSQPIPINKCRPSPQELEDDDLSAYSSSHYDWATWRMYERITTARRLRAFSRVGNSTHHHKQPMRMLMQDLDAIVPEQVMIHPEEAVVQPSTAEEFTDDGVFAFDAL